MKILKNKILAPYTTFSIGGPADYLVEAKTKKEIIKALIWAKKRKIPWFVLGSGSNILVSDKGLRGLVIMNKNSKTPKLQNSKIMASSGVSLAKLIDFATQHHLAGLEFLAGVPGTVGGAIVGNSGPKNDSMAQAVEKVIVLGEDGLIYDLTKEECQFNYRSSRFKKTKEIILEVVFKLKPSKPELIKKKIERALSLRKSQPQGKSAGSIFKNPPGEKAGHLIDKAGLKGKKIGGAMISKEHANWIVNLGHAQAKDVIKLIGLCKKKVKEKFNIELEEEIRLIGNF